MLLYQHMLAEQRVGLTITLGAGEGCSGPATRFNLDKKE
jgi:hypothetical protein